MANWYVSSVAYAAVAQFAINTVYTLGQYVRQLAAPAYGNERVFKVTTAGTSAAAEPAWNLGDGVTTTSGTAVFTQVAGRESEQLAGNWRAPFGTIKGADTAATAGIANFFVSSDHTETTSAAVTIGGNSARFWYSVSRTGASLPPAEADYLAGAAMATTGASNLTVQGSGFYKGFTFTCGNGSSVAGMVVGSTGDIVFENCSLVQGSTGAGNVFQFTASTFGTCTINFKNTTLTFAAAGQTVQMGNTNSFMRFTWTETPNALLGTVPTALFSAWQPIFVLIRGVDLSALNTALLTGAATSPIGKSYFVDCKMNATVLANAAISTTGFRSDDFMRFDNCDPSLNYIMKHINSGAVITSNTAVILAGGASDGVTAYSHKFVIANVASVATTFLQPSTGDWMQTRYSVTGSAKTLTVNLIAFSTLLPTNANLWLETEVLNTAGAPLAGGFTTRALLGTSAGTNVTTNSLAWDTGGVAARQNTHVYALGDQIKVASNPGRVFICTGAGTSAGSEPGGYASAVDGGAVTDNTATFRAGWRCSLSQAITPQVVGFLRARVMAAMASGVVIHVDPKLNIV